VADQNYVPQVDYTSRDFLSIRDDLYLLVPTYAPQWKSFKDSTDFGNALIQLQAYLGDLQSYYIDRSANEAFISTATKRSSILRQAALLDYQPTQSSPSYVKLKFSNTSAAPINVPAQTQVSAEASINGVSSQVIFETDSTITVPASTTTSTISSLAIASGTVTVTTSAAHIFYVGQAVTLTNTVAPFAAISGISATVLTVPSATTLTVLIGSSTVASATTTGAITGLGGATPGQTEVFATQGVTITEEIVTYSSTGEANQVYQLKTSPVIQSTVEVTVDYVAYERAQYLIDFPGSVPAFTVFTDADDISFIQFGDNIGGKIPPLGKVIRATYRVGGGEEGNVAAGALTELLNINESGLSVTNPAAAGGGASAETTDSIKVNAPISLKSLNRAVSLNDYSSLALQVSNVAKANSKAETYSSVVLYMALFGNRGVEADNVTPTYTFNIIKKLVASYLQGKAPANTSLTIAPPSYVPVDITLDLTVLPQYRQLNVKSAALAALAEILTFDNVLFSDRITLQYLMRVIANVPGVDYSQFNVLRRRDAQQFASVTNKALTSNVATLTTAAAHGLSVGQTVSITNVDDTFNGTFVVLSVPTTTTFTYAKTFTDVTSAAVTSSWTITKKALGGEVATITTSANHTIQAEDYVTISGLDATFNGTYYVLNTTPTTFTYARPGNTVVEEVAATGTARLVGVQVFSVADVVCGVNEIPEEGTITINASGGITS
jgi:hypothetical protein